MMANRKLPFGYEMQRGIICVKAAEASIVWGDTQNIIEEH